ncbi:ATP-binding protein, partial [Streptomyces sp. NPDC005859]
MAALSTDPATPAPALPLLPPLEGAVRSSSSMSENVVHLHKPTDPPADNAAPTVLTVVPDAPPARPVPLWVRSGRAVKTA